MRIALLFFVTVAVACGGSTSLSGAEDGGGDDGTSDAGAHWSPVCPDQQPSMGASCSPEGIECQYGTDPRVRCNPIFVCSLGTWAGAVGLGSCGPDTPNGSSCPADWSSVPRGSDCMPNGATCSYPQGGCMCAPPGFNGPPYPDASMIPVWQCEDPQPSGCPVPPARIGAPCSTPNQSCVYGQCIYGEICKDGVWQGQPVGCAGG
jgi:hypothetical protein